MKAIDRESYFWKAEYERLRRYKNKELNDMRVRFHNHLIKTWHLLKALGMKEEDIIKYYDE